MKTMVFVTLIACSMACEDGAKRGAAAQTQPIIASTSTQAPAPPPPPPAVPFEPHYLLPPQAGAVIMCCGATQVTDADHVRMGVTGVSARTDATYGLGAGYDKYAGKNELWVANVLDQESPGRDIQTRISARRVSEDAECIGAPEKGDKKVTVHGHPGLITKEDLVAVEVLSWLSTPWCFEVGVMSKDLARHLGDRGLLEIGTATAEWSDQFLPGEAVPAGLNLVAFEKTYFDAHHRKPRE